VVATTIPTTRPTAATGTDSRCSPTTDTTTPGYTNQYCAITGSGNGVAYCAVLYPTAYVDLTSTVQSIDMTNTTYAYLSMLNGDLFAHKFGPGDYFLLDVKGYTGAEGTGKQVGEPVDFYLANFLGSNSYIINTWQTLDLSSLAGAESLQFGLSSSGNNPIYGMNTPAYFAIDNLVLGGNAVPEPGSLIMMALGLTGLVGLGWKRRRAAALAACLLLGGLAAGARAGSYDPQVGLPGSLGIPNTSPLFTEWASSVISITRGPQDIADPNSPLASFGDPSNALGMANGAR